MRRGAKRRPASAQVSRAASGRRLDEGFVRLTTARRPTSATARLKRMTKTDETSFLRVPPGTLSERKKLRSMLNEAKANDLHYSQDESEMRKMRVKIHDLQLKLSDSEQRVEDLLHSERRSRVIELEVENEEFYGQIIHLRTALQQMETRMQEQKDSAVTSVMASYRLAEEVTALQVAKEQLESELRRTRAQLVRAITVTEGTVTVFDRIEELEQQVASQNRYIKSLKDEVERLREEDRVEKRELAKMKADDTVAFTTATLMSPVRQLKPKKPLRRKQKNAMNRLTTLPIWRQKLIPERERRGLNGELLGTSATDVSSEKGTGEKRTDGDGDGDGGGDASSKPNANAAETKVTETSDSKSTPKRAPREEKTESKKASPTPLTKTPQTQTSIRKEESMGYYTEFEDTPKAESEDESFDGSDDDFDESNNSPKPSPKEAEEKKTESNGGGDDGDDDDDDFDDSDDNGDDGDGDDDDDGFENDDDDDDDFENEDESKDGDDDFESEAVDSDFEDDFED